MNNQKFYVLTKKGLDDIKKLWVRDFYISNGYIRCTDDTDELKIFDNFTSADEFAREQGTGVVVRTIDEFTCYISVYNDILKAVYEYKDLRKAIVHTMDDGVVLYFWGTYNIEDVKKCDKCGGWAYNHYKVYKNENEHTTMCRECVRGLLDGGLIECCGGCGRYYHSENITTEEVYDEEDEETYTYRYCRWCYAKRERECYIASYHTHKKSRTPIFWNKDGHTDAKDFAGFGLEIEVDRRSCASGCVVNECLHKIVDTVGVGHLYFERDGSLDNGFEIITQPHTEKALKMVDFEKVFEILKSYEYLAHDIKTCGLHIHISRRYFGKNEAEQTRAVGKMLAFYDTYFDDVLKISRRTQQQAERWANKYCLYGYTQTQKENDARKQVKIGGSSRYMAVNLTNKNTVEVRLMRGTLNINTFWATIQFVIDICKRSKSIKWADINNAEKWLINASKNSLDYAKTRGAFDDAINNVIQLQKDKKEAKESKKNGGNK